MSLFFGIPAFRGNYHGVPTMKKLDGGFISILEDLSEHLTEIDVEQIQELVGVGELGVAFENFCTQLYERDAICTQAQYDRIAIIGNTLGVKIYYWKNLAVA